MAEETIQARELDFADQLLQELDGSEAWPLPREMKPRALAAEGRALRNTDRDWLRHRHGWDIDRLYVADSLPRRIAFGWADFLFANDVTITAAGDQDETTRSDPAEREEGNEDPVDTTGNTARDVAQEEIDHTVEECRMPALLHRAARKAVSEGEAYWKLHTNAAVADVALLSWCSRLDTVPLFYGDRLVAAAFFTERKRVQERWTPEEDEYVEVVYRHAEIHTVGRVLNVLYRGTEEKLGVRVPLTLLEEAAGYTPEWQHGLPMLAGRVVNDLEDDDTFGVSEYAGVTDELLALNEAMTIAVENMRLTGQDRIFAAGKFLQADGSFDASMQVFQHESDESTLGEGDGKPPIFAIEKRYDAAPAWMHITNLVKTIVNRVGLVPQWIGENTEGHGETGVAIRLRFIPTTNAAKGKLREWGHVIPHIIDLQLKIASLPVEQGGFGRDVAQDEPPAVEFADPIPSDQSRDLLDVSAAVVSEVMSRKTAVATLHPEWTGEQVQEEIDAITKDRETTVAAGPPAPLPPNALLPEPEQPIKPAQAPSSAGR